MDAVDTPFRGPLAWRWIKNFLKYRWKGLILFLWPLICLPIFLRENTSQMRCLYVVCVMALFWITEVLPLPITSVIPIGLFPIMGILNSKETTIQYFQETIVMIWGSMILAFAVEQCGLSFRAGLLFMRMLGTTHRMLTLGISFFTMFLSMWMANAAAVAIMCPIATTLLEELEEAKLMKVYLDDKGEEHEQGEASTPYPSRTTICYFLSITYAATIGGTGTIVGTGTNLAFKGIYETRFPTAPEIGFMHWMAYAIPPMIVSQFLVWVFMNWMYLGLFRKSGMDPEIKRQMLEDKQAVKQSQETVRRAIAEKMKEMGPFTYEEVITGILFLTCIMLWVFRNPQFVKGWAEMITQHKVGDSVPVVVIVILFFMLPGDMNILKNFSTDEKQWPRRESKGLLVWKYIQSRMPWGLLLLIGGGFAVAEGSKKSGMSTMIGNSLKSLGNLHSILLLFLTGFIATNLTEFTSNVAIANIILPVLAEMAVAIEIHPMQLMFPATICCSFAYMLPVGTPGNAYVAAMVNIRTKDMMIAGIVPKLICLAVVVIFFPTWGHFIYGTNVFPDWASNSSSNAPKMLYNEALSL